MTTHGGATEPRAAEDDAQRYHPGYGAGGVPWYLLVGYLAFLVFFTWYVLEYQLPDYLDQGPGRAHVAEDVAR